MTDRPIPPAPPPDAGRPLAGRRVLAVIGGGIAAYKVLEAIRRLRDRGAAVRCVMTRSATEFVTPLSVSALSGETVQTDLFAPGMEAEIGHIRLARDCDLVLVAPATANLLARMALGLCDDLATTVLLATDRPILVCPAMNVKMWQHPATVANMATLATRGVAAVGPNEGAMAEAEWGPGRLAEPEEIVDAVTARLTAGGPLAGRRAVVTSGPTHEPIDPVRFLGNRSSGKQGHAIAASLAAAGAETVLVTGPTAEPDPPGVRAVHVETARQMLAAVDAALPADIAVCAAAVADWRVEAEGARKIKKGEGGGPPRLSLVENPDILATLSRPGPSRPALVVGFAAETEDVVEQARAKRLRKGCDWILANDVAPGTGTFGGAENTVHLITGDGEPESWPRATKREIGDRLAVAIAARLGPPIEREAR